MLSWKTMHSSLCTHCGHPHGLSGALCGAQRPARGGAVELTPTLGEVGTQGSPFRTPAPLLRVQLGAGAEEAVLVLAPREPERGVGAGKAKAADRTEPPGTETALQTSGAGRSLSNWYRAN